MKYIAIFFKHTLQILTLLSLGALMACSSIQSSQDENEAQIDPVSADIPAGKATVTIRQDGSGTEMALVPAGEFQMATFDEIKGQTSVETIYVQDFYLDIHEVTNQDYAGCVQDGVCSEPANTMEYQDPSYQDHPVIFVTWDMANTYCQWRGARLPTKAEWEKAAADELAEIEYFWGDISPVCQVGARLGAGPGQLANYDPATEAVMRSGPNTYGLYDLTGGMWEWVQDEYAAAVYDSNPETVSFLRMFRKSGYGPLYTRFMCSLRCASSP
jgi:formylglycine-generating enzyme required for sulfatase activity